MEKVEKLAKIIVNHSLKVKENDKVLITYQGAHAIPLVKCIVKEVINNKGIPDTEYTNQDIDEYIKNNLTDEIITEKAKKMKYQVENYDCFARICYCKSDYYGKNIDKEMHNKLMESLKPYKEIQVNQRRWVLLNYPSIVDSAKAHMTPEEFYNFSMDAMTVDYDKMYNDSLKL